MGKISREKGSLIHDDSIDAVAGAVRYWTERVAEDEVKRMAQKEHDDTADFFAEWGAQMSPKHMQGNGVLGSSINRFKNKTTMRQRRH